MMVHNAEKQELQMIKQGVANHFPLLASLTPKITFAETSNVQTAATDGKHVFYSNSYTCQLTFEEKIFLFAHEIMHIAFDHVLRSGTKDPEIWNYATDAVINQMLKASGLPMPAGGIDLPEAAGKSAEEVYADLIQAKNQTTTHKAQGEHGLWAEAVKAAAKEQNAQKRTAPEISSQREKLFTQTNQARKQRGKLTTLAFHPHRHHLKQTERLLGNA